MPEHIHHRVVATSKELHGWYPAKRECTSERLLINPYNGCGVGCFFCYARALPGHFASFHHTGLITLAKNFDKTVGRQLDSIGIASCGYLSPVTDPFQRVNSIYKLSEKIITEFAKRNIPIEFITKCRVPEEAMEFISGHPHCFAQASILTSDEDLRKILAPGGAYTKELFSDLRRMSKKGIFTVCRIDPILPYLTDSGENLKSLVKLAAENGVKHVIASVMDIPVKISGWIFDYIGHRFGEEMRKKYIRLYTEKIGYINANINYRKRIFAELKQICTDKGLTFALCMEFESAGGGAITGLNRLYMTSTNCEGINIPVYTRRGGRFVPAAACSGACLTCATADCGITELAMARSLAAGKPPKTSFKLSDYRRWSDSQIEF